MKTLFIVAFILVSEFSGWPPGLWFPQKVQEAKASPVVVASSIGDNNGAGASMQSHIIYAQNSAQWWIFYVNLGSKTTLRTAYSNDLSTWNAGGTLTLAHSLTSNEDMSVAYMNISSTDVMHIQLSYNINGASRLAHVRATITPNTVTFGTESQVGTTSGISPNDPDENAVAYDSNNHVWIEGGWDATCTQDPCSASSVNADLGPGWTSGFSPFADLDTSAAGSSQSAGLFSIGSGKMLDITDDTAQVNDTFTQLHYFVFNGTSWSAKANVLASALGTAQSDQDWAAVRLSDTDIRVVARSGSNTYVWRKFDGSTWSTPSASIPNQTSKAGNNIFLTTDGTNIWLFVIDTDSANTVRYVKYDGSNWGSWTALDTSTQVRTSISGYPAVANNTIAVAYTQQNGATYDLVVSSLALPTTAGTTAVEASNRSDTLSDSRPSATSNHTITFTSNNAFVTGASSASSSLTLTFPSAFNLSNVNCRDVDISLGGTATSIAGYNVNRSSSQNCPGSATSWGLFIDPTATTITFYTPTSAATYAATGTAVLVKIGSNASFQDNGTAWITNPSAAGTYTISLGGTSGISGNMLVQIGVNTQSAVTAQAQVAESLALTVSSVGTSANISLVQQRSTFHTSGTSIALAYSSGNSAGDMLIVAAADQCPGSTNMSISDSLGNSYSPAVKQNNNIDSNQYWIWYAANSKAGANTVTVTGNACGFGGMATQIYEYSGVATASPLDQTATSGCAVSCGNTLSVTTTQATAQASELAFALGLISGGNRTWTAGTGYALRQTTWDGTNLLGTAGEDGIATSAGVVTATFKLNSGAAWNAAIATFKPASSGGCTPDDGATVTQINTTATAVPFGTISPNTFYQGCQDLTVSTNAGGGYSLSAQENSAMKTADGKYTIPDTTCDGGGCTTVTAATWVTATKNGFGHTCTNQTGSDCNATFGSGTKFKPLPNIATGNGVGNISFVQSNFALTNSNAQPNVAFNSNNTAGDLIVVALDWNSISANVLSVTDTVGNVYVNATGPGNGTGLFSSWQQQLFYAKNIGSGANTVYVKFSGAVNSEFYIHEYSGADKTVPLDVTASSTGSSSAPNSGSKNTNFANELVFGYCQSDGAACTPGTNFTGRRTDDGNLSEDMIVSSAGGYSASGNIGGGGDWIMSMATFKAAPVNPLATLMSNTGPVSSSTGRVKYRLSVPSSQAAGAYSTLVTYTIWPTY